MSSINHVVLLDKGQQTKMYFGNKDARKLSQEEFVEVRRGVAKEDLKKSVEKKKEKQTQENFPGLVWF